MKYCNSCHISFNTSSKLCPLCQNKLEGICNDVVFPKNIRLSTNSLIMKIILFSSIVVFLITNFVELYITGKIKYGLYINLGLITNICIIYVILKNYQDILRMFEKYGLILILIILGWYLVTKNKIITNYIIPSICLVELLFNLVVGIILRSNYLVKYSGLILVNLILLVLPSLLVILGLTSNNLMSYICLICAIIAISGLVIFCFDSIKEELSKIFNV